MPSTRAAGFAGDWCTQFAADAKEYVPQYELWADGATKHRWITLPPGAKIDTSDMSSWKFLLEGDQRRDVVVASRRTAIGPRARTSAETSGATRT
ncbi:MAG: hypothetical protein H0T79_02085 [Deltaproteobacteria bacterium]|nr:hypothetical protein [Deltaproteobacteria bacterium]